VRKQERISIVADKTHTGNVLITGTSTGIGRSCSLQLDRLGFRVLAGVRRIEDGEALRFRSSEQLKPILLDVTEKDSIESARREIRSIVGTEGLQGLVNNAGIVVVGPLEVLPVAEIRRQMDVNLLGSIAVTQAFLDLIRSGCGRIVNMSSIAGQLASPFTGSYSMSKFALEAFSDALRMELAPWGVPVSVIEPGNVATPIWDKSRARGESIYEALGTDARSLYGDQLTRLREVAQRIGRRGVSPDRVAAAVAHAITSKRPRTRYVVGLDSKALRLLSRWIPDRLMDRLILRGLGLADVRIGAPQRR
jgi:NAD(P)-dependent dehydrogenase (short-subunit alcohol dehydrogenase family)